jgi:hypothetical protein
MEFSLYATTPTEEIFLQTSNELKDLQKQSKYVYIRWMGEMGLISFNEDAITLLVLQNGYPHSTAKLSTPRRAWVPVSSSVPSSASST